MYLNINKRKQKSKVSPKIKLIVFPLFEKTQVGMRWTSQKHEESQHGGQSKIFERNKCHVIAWNHKLAINSDSINFIIPKQRTTVRFRSSQISIKTCDWNGEKLAKNKMQEEQRPHKAHARMYVMQSLNYSSPNVRNCLPKVIHAFVFSDGSWMVGDSIEKEHAQNRAKKQIQQHWKTSGTSSV